MSTRPRMGMPSNVSWPVMGGHTVHPTGATLALVDPPRSLNASGENLGYLPGRGAQRFAPWVVLERFPGPVATAGAAVMYGRGSGRRSDPLHHRGNIEEVSYLAAGGERKNRAPRRHNQSMESGLGSIGVVVP